MTGSLPRVLLVEEIGSRPIPWAVSRFPMILEGRTQSAVRASAWCPPKELFRFARSDPEVGRCWLGRVAVALGRPTEASAGIARPVLRASFGRRRRKQSLCALKWPNLQPITLVRAAASVLAKQNRPLVAVANISTVVRWVASVLLGVCPLRSRLPRETPMMTIKVLPLFVRFINSIDFDSQCTHALPPNAINTNRAHFCLVAVAGAGAIILAVAVAGRGPPNAHHVPAGARDDAALLVTPCNTQLIRHPSAAISSSIKRRHRIDHVCQAGHHGPAAGHAGHPGHRRGPLLHPGVLHVHV